jgi:hypothetical protein
MQHIPRFHRHDTLLRPLHIITCCHHISATPDIAPHYRCTPHGCRQHSITSIHAAEHSTTTSGLAVSLQTQHNPHVTCTLVPSCHAGSLHYLANSCAAAVAHCCHRHNSWCVISTAAQCCHRYNSWCVISTAAQCCHRYNSWCVISTAAQCCYRYNSWCVISTAAQCFHRYNTAVVLTCV